MPWNEPEDEKKRDDKPNVPSGKREGPPDLEQALKQLWRRLRLSSKKETRHAESTDENNAHHQLNKQDNATPKNSDHHNRDGSKDIYRQREPQATPFFSISFIVLVIIILWFLSGFYVVGPAEQGALLRFGRCVEIVDSGPHWFARFIDKVAIINVKQVDSISYANEMLTKQTNLVTVQLTVRYRINAIKDFLFNTLRPIETLKEATGSAVQQVISQYTLDDILSEKRGKIRDEIQQNITDIIAPYQVGLSVTEVTLQVVKPPQEVSAAFDDLVKAREERKRYIAEAEAYSADILPLAEGRATKQLALAKADSDKLVSDAEAGVATFLALLPTHQIAPQVMEQRLYLNTMQEILEKSSTVLIDSHNNTVYLPTLNNFSNNNGMNNSVNNVKNLPSNAAMNNAGSSGINKLENQTNLDLQNADNTNRASNHTDPNALATELLGLRPINNSANNNDSSAAADQATQTANSVPTTPLTPTKAASSNNSRAIDTRKSTREARS